MTATSFARRAACATVFALLMLAPSRAQDTEFGTTTFANSGDAAAQPAFLRGVLLLHSFEYDDARTYFQEAQRMDPDFALAYWGEAMTHNHPVWMRQEHEEAVGALRKLGETAAARLTKAGTDRERDYLRAIDVLLGTGDGTGSPQRSKHDRDDAYADAMQSLAARYPDDLDARAFYALALLGTAHEGRDYATYMKSAAVAEEVFAANPRHPGAAHYLIHAYDDPVHAPLGIRPARVYADLAPSASHALHMPSHIFFALGDWAAASTSNEDAYRAAFDRSVRLGVGLGGHGYHALLWLGYSYLQEGRNAEALVVVARADSLYRAEGTSRSAHTLTWLRAHTLVELDDVEAAGLGRMPEGDHGASTQAAQYFAQAYAAYLEDDAELLAEMLAALEARETDGTGGRSGAIVAIIQMQVEALGHQLRGDTVAALEATRAAMELEHAQPLAFGPTAPPKPSAELLGDLLLASGDREAAHAAYNRVAERAPNRRRTAQGLRDVTTKASRSTIDE